MLRLKKTKKESCKKIGNKKEGYMRNVIKQTKEDRFCFIVVSENGLNSFGWNGKMVAIFGSSEKKFQEMDVKGSKLVF